MKHPENFVPGVSDVIIKEKTSDFVIRSMDITTPDRQKTTVVERITNSPYWVKFLIIEHPLYTGNVDNVAEKISATETKITFTLDWKNKKTGEFFSNQEMIKNAVIKTTDFIRQSKLKGSWK